MIEIIYNESGNKGNSVVIKPPKNIRQIGNPKGRHRIYVEDYVYTFLHSAAYEKKSRKRAAVLVGKSEVTQDIRYTFISAAINCDDLVFREEGIVFDEKTWEYIYKEIKEYFPGQDVTGWFLGMEQMPMELTPAIEAAQRKYFAGKDKILYLADPAEGEEVFFVNDQGTLQKKEGYYIYYEKNLPMQEYMVNIREQRKTVSDSGQSIKDNQTDQVIRSYRSMMQNKKEKKMPKKFNLVLYTATSAALVVLCVIGVTTMNNYDKMKNVEKTLTTISDATESDNTEVHSADDTDKNTDTNSKTEDKIEEQQSMEDNAQDTQKTEDVQDTLVVETVPGEVEPVENEGEDEQEEKMEGQEDKIEEPQEEQPQGQDNLQNTQDEQILEDEPIKEPQEEQPQSQPEAETSSSAVSDYLTQGYYIVQKGDKLETICKSIYKTTAMLDKLCEVNEIENVDMIFVGQKLVLP